MTVGSLPRLGLLVERNPGTLEGLGGGSLGRARVPVGVLDAAGLRPARQVTRHSFPKQVEMIGRLDTYVTRTGFEVTPCVGFVAPPEAYRPDPFEVAEVFEVPLQFLLDAAGRLNAQPARRRRGRSVRTRA